MSELEELSIFVEKIIKVFFYALIFLMTSWSNIFLLDPSIFTWVTDNNKKEIEQKIISTSTWSNLAMFLIVLAHHPNRIRLLGLHFLVGRICRNVF